MISLTKYQYYLHAGRQRPVLIESREHSVQMDYQPTNQPRIRAQKSIMTDFHHPG